VNNKEREMPKSAQQKFNEYLDECRETTNAISEVTDRTNEAYDGYAFAAGYLGSMLADVISELPKARRAELRDRLLAKAQEAKNEYLLKTIKETA
jgi:hypothetical protein